MTHLSGTGRIRVRAYTCSPGKFHSVAFLGLGTHMFRLRLDNGGSAMSRFSASGLQGRLGPLRLESCQKSAALDNKAGRVACSTMWYEDPNPVNTTPKHTKTTDPKDDSPCNNNSSALVSDGGACIRHLHVLPELQAFFRERMPALAGNLQA